LKVLVMSHMYPHLNNSNSGTFVHEQVVELQRQGIEVVVLCTLSKSAKALSYLSQKWKNYYEQPPFVELDGIPVHFDNYFVIPRNLFYHTSGTRMYNGIVDKATRLHEIHQFELIHAHVALPDGYAAVKLGDKFDIPVITTIHGQDVQTVIHKSKQCKEKIESVINQSDATVFVSNKLLQLKEQHLSTKNDRSVVINNGLPELFTDNSERRNPNKTIQLISISNLKNTKGLNYNLEALYQLKKEGFSFHYSIVGEGEEKENLKTLVTNYDLDNEVSFLGLLNRKEVLNQLQKSDIFTMPSWQEGFGMVYLEAMSQSLPVIACLGEGIEDVVIDGENGYLVKPKDHIELKEVLMRLIKDEELRHKIGENAKNSIASNFTLSKVVKQLIDLYDSVLNRKGGR
jgi:teichuronic acid biosynthesis glycosyltransferase TuaC